MKRNVPVSSIMSTEPVTVHHGQKLSDVQTLMAERGFHHVPVVSGDRVVGMLTSTDVLRVSYQYGQDPRQADAILDHTLSLEDVMTKDVSIIGAKESIRRAFEILAEGRFHALPVVEDDVLVGIVTTTDLLNYALEQY
ncbi:MAG: CBS domain-containing protein [Myxococcales bacterium]|nr:CBS domain-containing protein [Myxococcales bacterium]